jgi:dTDP-4-dehydrorhamnose reductase
MTRILVTGASGLLGLNFAIQYQTAHQVMGVVNTHGLQNMSFAVVKTDLNNPRILKRLLVGAAPEVVIHAAAIANLEACEKNPALAQQVNADLPGELAKLTRELGMKMVHISTDAVFDGEQGNYEETDEPNPLSVYSRTKLEGEQQVMAANPEAVVARVNFFGWSLTGRRSLSEFFYNNLSAGKPMKGFTDVNFCPLQVNQLAETLMEMVSLDLKGIYHVVSKDSLSKYEFGCRIADQFGFDKGLIAPVSWQDGGLTARRSPNLTLNVDRLTAALGAPMPGIESGIRRFYQQHVDGYPEKIRGMAI